MTAPVTPIGAPIPQPAAGKAKGQKGDGAPNEPGFASLLAAMATPPGQASTGVPVLPIGEGQEQAGAPPSGTPGGNGLLTGTQLAWTVVQGTPAATNAQVPESAKAPPFQEALAGAVADMAVTTEPVEGPAPQAGVVLTTEPVELPDQAALPGTDTPEVPGETPETHPVRVVPVQADGEEGSSPVETGPGEGESEPGEHGTPEQQRNPRANDPSVTRGLDRAAQVSQALENRPADAPNADKFPLANRVAPQPAQPVEATPEVPVPPVVDAAPEPVQPLHPVEGQPVQPAAAEQAQPDAPVEQPRPLHQLNNGRYEPRQLIDQLARAITTLDDGQYSVTLRLHPEQLGEVRLQLHMSGREVHAAMEVVNQDARQLLENRSEQLRQSLSQSGLTLSGFEVNTGQKRQSFRDRQDALTEALAGANRRIQPGDVPGRGAVNRFGNTDRRGGRLDTMA